MTLFLKNNGSVITFNTSCGIAWLLTSAWLSPTLSSLTHDETEKGLEIYKGHSPHVGGMPDPSLAYWQAVTISLG